MTANPNKSSHPRGRIIRPHLYSEDSAVEPSKETADRLLLNSIRCANEGIPYRRRERVWPAIVQAIALLVLSIVLMVKL